MSDGPAEPRPSRSKLDAASRAAEAVGLGWLLRRRSPGVACLVYHRVGTPGPDGWDPTVFEAGIEQFDAQMGFISRSFDVVGPEDLEEIVARRRRGRHVLITFDDGYRDSYEHGFRLVRKHGLKATFFITSGFLDDRTISWWDQISGMVRRTERREVRVPGRERPPVSLEPAVVPEAVRILTSAYKELPAAETDAFLDELAERLGTDRAWPGDDPWMTWDTVREMRAAGMTIGGHTATHPVLARLPAERQREEILISKARLEEELGEPMRWFSYPVGARDTFAPETQAVLREAGVELAFSYYGGSPRRDRWDPLDVPRRGVVRNASLAYFRMALTLPDLYPNR
ncbi:MAG TPA: polysaccharide deacetylase family protein [Solirubrobacteraceae bacterium]|nr:polysaccharide deacetylase family protein [Solirubrobacteraceae bacterium]